MKRRGFPYIWPTWLTGLLSGDNSCEYAAWYKAHWEKYNKIDDGFDFNAWKENHTELVNQLRAKLEADGAKVYTEDQNAFTWRGEHANIGGKPDLVAIWDVMDHEVFECKTGKTRASDEEQVKIYLAALPRGTDRHTGREMKGQVVYGQPDPKGGMTITQQIEVPATSIDEKFKGRLSQLVLRIADKEQARAVPSERECGFCDIRDCEFRFKPQPVVEGEAWF